MSKDTIYSSSLSTVPSFTFDQKVVEVFDDMISRSVPHYQEVCATTAACIKGFAQKNTRIYDIGCSTGTLLAKLAESTLDESISLVGLDSSTAMIQEARRRHAPLVEQNRLSFEHADVLTYSFEDASAVICNYTLQFLPIDTRLQLLSRISTALCTGGIALITEKVRHPHQKLQNIITELHHDFKRRQGYSDLEIAQKRQAIEDVLIPLTMEENIEMLTDAGFDTVYPVLTWYTFVTFVALKLH